MLLSIIIVNYNVKYFLEQCLYSVQGACEGLETETIVIDNASTDGSRQWLEAKFPWVQFNWLTENLGFGKANNLALKNAKGDHILFLNPDTIIAEDTLRLCVAEMKDTTIGALGVRMIDGSGRFLKESKRGLPTGAAAFFKLSGLIRLFPRSKKIAAYYAGNLPPQLSHDVDILSGAFMMLSKKAAGITKGFDEDFFMYGEDVDLSYRIKKAGMRCRYFAGTSILHFKGESTQKNTAGYQRNFYGAMRLFVKKHFPEKKFLSFSTGMALAAARLIGAFKAQRKTPDALNKPLRTAAIADQQVFDKCLQLLKFSPVPLSIVGRIDPKKDNHNRSIGSLDNMEETIKKNQLQQIVLCNGSLPVKEMIGLAEKTGKKTELLFWMKESNSMVGSNNKNKRGKFIATATFSNDSPNH